MNKYNQLLINYYNRMGKGIGLAFKAVLIITVLMIILLLIPNDCRFKVISEMAVWSTEC